MTTVGYQTQSMIGNNLSMVNVKEVLPDDAPEPLEKGSHHHPLCRCQPYALQADRTFCDQMLASSTMEHPLIDILRNRLQWKLLPMGLSSLLLGHAWSKLWTLGTDTQVLTCSNCWEGIQVW